MTDVNNNTTYIQELLTPANLPLTTGTREWLREGILQHLKTGESLQKSLGLKRRHYMLSVRNHHLMNAYSHINNKYSDKRKASELLHEINQCYKIFRNDPCDGEPNPRWSQLRQEIYYAVRCNVGMPGCDRQIENIAKSFGHLVS